MSDYRETLKFGDPVMNIAASEDNPIKRGVFVRNVVRTGKLNAGRFVEYMTGDGATHLTPPDNIAKDGISAADEIAGLRVSEQAAFDTASQLIQQRDDALNELASLKDQFASAMKQTARSTQAILDTDSICSAKAYARGLRSVLSLTDEQSEVK